MLPRIQAQLIHNIVLLLPSPPQLLPFRLLHAGQVVRRVDVAHFPPPDLLALEVPRGVASCDILHRRAGCALRFSVCGVADHVGGDVDACGLACGNWDCG
jgi:hypothetical protein